MTAATAPVLEARGVTMRFGGLTAVENVDLTVGPGEIVGLIGPNGAGKTTFFNCLSGLYRPSSGQVLVGGVPLPPRPHAAARAGLARTFQNIRLFPNMTVTENVMVGNHIRTRQGLFSAIGYGPRYRHTEKATRTLARELLDFAGIHQHAESPARSLPYGDQRRLEVARALASDPSVLLLDEPTAGMNPAETRQMRDLVLAIRDRGVSVLVIEHDMRFVFGLCDCVVVLINGRKLLQGNAEQVQADERVIEAYLGTPASADREGPAAPAGSAEAENTADADDADTAHPHGNPAPTAGEEG
ncbi:ABC transporter ATP-binding protein [Nocardia aurantia]|uniref:Lipopolysaccharide export system ATP-binding protein LptB n=1 Tax=Nocardia aurantia TaxID=2585199 RepID=A0A7K0DVI5_9NOCA|nr:ABC transporter ATP-binding protein [Nocardia aurantia]MQY29800.1 Lipopolysaccharide export system ATP-binding protein LptB [Nocardia aurantia]